MSNLAMKLNSPIIKLDLGCGHRNRKQPESEWIHIDIQEIEGIDIVADFSELTMFDNASVDEIYSGDSLEHISPWNLRKVLTEWNRILKVGGKFTGQTPNLHSTMIRYSKGELSLDDAIGALYGSNELVYQHHFCTYTVETLSKLLWNYGFTEIDFNKSPGSENPNMAWWIVFECLKEREA